MRRGLTETELDGVDDLVDNDLGRVKLLETRRGAQTAQKQSVTGDEGLPESAR